MTQVELFYDDIDAALRATVEALGGAKRVGTALWPAMDAVSAQTQLLSAMNPDKPHKLSLRGFWLVVGMAQKQGIHVIAKFFADDLGYEFRVIQKEEKQAELVERFAKMKSEMADLMKAMERMG